MIYQFGVSSVLVASVVHLNSNESLIESEDKDDCSLGAAFHEWSGRAEAEPLQQQQDNWRSFIHFSHIRTANIVPFIRQLIDFVAQRVPFKDLLQTYLPPI